MTSEMIQKILNDTAYIHTGGSDEELRCAEYLAAIAGQWGLKNEIEPFDVTMATVKRATLTAITKEGEISIPCEGYRWAGSHEVEAPLYYMPHADKHALSGCKGKIVLIDSYLGNWIYNDMLENGAVGFITYDGNANYTDCDIDKRELRSFICEKGKLPGVNINAKSAIALVRDGVEQVKIVLEQDEYTGQSRNVVVDIPGQIEETVIFTAHYDTTPLSQGAYDNMSGCIGLLGLMEHYKDHTPHRSLRFVFCGSEERGLLGSKAYVAAHESELDKIVLNINVDMIGSIMGGFLACSTAETDLVAYIRYLAMEVGFVVNSYQGVYSSDSTPLADKGIPAVSFARSAPGHTATIHNSYDTAVLLKPEHIIKDTEFIRTFADRMIAAVRCPVKREMPDNMKEALDKYLLRKR